MMPVKGMVLFKLSFIVGFTFLISSTAFSQQEIPKDLVIKMERGACHQYCPFYLVTVHGDGSLTFQPKYWDDNFKESFGELVTAKISIDKVRTLISEFNKMNFQSLKPEYGVGRDSIRPPECLEMLTDASTVNLSIETNSSKKSVAHYLGCHGSKILLDLTKLEETIDEIVNTDQWTSKLEWGFYGSRPKSNR
jgi:hypothetical protein